MTRVSVPMVDFGVRDPTSNCTLKLALNYDRNFV